MRTMTVRKRSCDNYDKDILKLDNEFLLLGEVRCAGQKKTQPRGIVDLSLRGPSGALI